MLPVLSPEFSANPLALVRSLPTEMIPIDQIKVPEGLPTDEIFLAKYDLAPVPCSS